VNSSACFGITRHGQLFAGQVSPELLMAFRLAVCPGAWRWLGQNSNHGPDCPVEPQDVFPGHLFGFVRLTCRNCAQQFYVLTDVLVHGG